MLEAAHEAGAKVVLVGDSRQLQAIERARRFRVLTARAYPHVDHGYAMTLNKSQSVAVHRAYVMASKLFDASAAYVALSRHRDHVETHWARDEYRCLV